ncbi:helix-turn-helix domain-containing protein [Microbispora sp. RL4-1S]|uniref:Helix-turn-helix domain-containing protein n=1 Tax=Microbispora oryzae TaxID=2806554 RepID=A0A941AIF8_9ACTN|nr:helix-turn-helix transcriptional regulator [Microbispora oryzae]MBP2705160.1 helix-turn-helix domain-containing protein [Microbispora oryzae]
MDTPKAVGGDNPLGDFLRARRELLRPEQTGLVSGGRRRVSGLRREEVALLAGVSTDYYTRLEQGRERHPSAQVLDAVCRVLQLDEQSRALLDRLARPSTRRRRRPRSAEKVSDHLVRLMEAWPDTPAFVIGIRLDILARNRLTEALLQCFSPPDNLARMVFLDPVATDFYRDVNRVAQHTIVLLRAAAEQSPHDTRLAELVGELSIRSGHFRQLWCRPSAPPKGTAILAFHHPEVGDLDLRLQMFTVNAAPGQQLVVLHPERPSAVEGLALLGTIAAGDGVSFGQSRTRAAQARRSA